MAAVDGEQLRQWHHKAKHTPDQFITGIPKIELHIHVEGCLTPELRWKMAERNGLTVYDSGTGEKCNSLEELRSSYYPLFRPGYVHGGPSEFFKSYFAGLDVLREEEDFYELAMEYYKRAASMNIAYCEVFFDPQGHTSRGVGFEKFMPALRRARDDAVTEFQLEVNYIACVYRDHEVDAGLEHYKKILPYRDMIVGIGLDSVETDRPPMLFEPLFDMARKDGFKITCHCDIGQEHTFSNITEVVEQVGGGTGADRCDHGISAARSPELVAKIRDKGIGMTMCPWGYVRYQPASEIDIPGKIRALYDAGIKITINSDDPGYMDDLWLEENLHFVRQHCHFLDAEIKQLQLNAVDMSWASEATKSSIREKIEGFSAESSKH